MRWSLLNETVSSDLDGLKRYEFVFRGEKRMCGIVGVVSQSRVNQLLYDALTVLQHRGQDAWVWSPVTKWRLYLRKDNGMVRDVFHKRHMERLVGNVGIGHVRYPTAGSSTRGAAFYVNSPYGITPPITAT